VSLERRVLVWTAVIFAFCVLLYALRDILLPFVAAILIAYALDPAADKLERLGTPRWAASGLLVAAFVIAILAFFLLFVPLFQSEFARAITKLPDYVLSLRGRLEDLSWSIERQLSPEDAERVRTAVAGMADDLAAWMAGLFSGVLASGLAIFNVLSLLLLTPLIAFYLLNDWDRVVARVDAWLPRGSAPTIRAIIHDIDRNLAGFVRGQGIVCLILAGFYSIALTVIGLDFGLAVGLIAGILTFVPYLGSLVGFVLSVGLAVAQFGTWDMILLTAGIFVFGQIAEGNFITPKIVGSSVGLHEGWIIFALLAGGSLLGFVGVLLAVPLAATIGVLVRHGLERYRASSLYHSDDGTPKDY
jgi:predicted PurR-regulated permease PerM